ncbi:hypothetical protein SynMVIR181_02892 [Synechococcus sp. MVIR-18-1]|nr:hypothetical protein SynMVIR181_02892 [Synechococcus sp. MVIR-18-1]
MIREQNQPSSSFYAFYDGIAQLWKRRQGHTFKGRTPFLE